MYIMNKAILISESSYGIEIKAPAKADFFIDELSETGKNDAPFYYEKVKGDFVVSTKVHPSFTRRYDAGGLFILDSLRKWIKLEFEMTDLGYPAVVSVITKGDSDDCNGERFIIMKKSIYR